MSALDVLAEHRPSATGDVLAAKQFVVGDLFGTAAGAPAYAGALMQQFVADFVRLVGRSGQ